MNHTTAGGSIAPMAFPLPTDLAAMEALSVDAIPEGDGWQYEPKWDGFRCLAFRDGAQIDLRSKAGQPLARYFPDVVAALADIKPKRFVLDGEIVIPGDGEKMVRQRRCQSRWRDREAHGRAVCGRETRCDGENQGAAHG